MTRHLCAACQERRARFQYRGVVKADRQHVLCFQCYRAARERLRARQIGSGALALERPAPARQPGAKRPLTPRQIEHRRAMLAHLERQASA
jgi:hypothetical protein